MSQVRITFTEDEIKTLCNALLWIDEYAFETGGPTHVNSEILEHIKDVSFNARHCLEYRNLFSTPNWNCVEVVE